LLAHIVVAGSVVQLALPETVRIALFVLVAFSLFFTLRQQWRPVVVMLHLGASGELAIERKVGISETAIIEPHSAILPGLIVLLLRCGTQRIALPLIPDALDPDLKRQLRVWLQWRAKK
jgi:hypothetical protein